VVDASALAALLFGEPEGEAIAALLDGARLVAPSLLGFELANVCLIKARRHPQQADALRTAFRLRDRLEVEEAAVNHDGVLDLASATGLTAYDAAISGWPANSEPNWSRWTDSLRPPPPCYELSPKRPHVLQLLTELLHGAAIERDVQTAVEPGPRVRHRLALSRHQCAVAPKCVTAKRRDDSSLQSAMDTTRRRSGQKSPSTQCAAGARWGG
jgi:predicted nucleic acid-binding protein